MMAEDVILIDESNDSPTWEGNVTIRRMLFPKYRRCQIWKDRLVFLNKDKTEIEIKSEKIQSINLPEFGATEFLLTGYRGIIVEYLNQSGTKKTISFWAKGFGSYPDGKENQVIVTILSSIFAEKIKNIKALANQNMVAKLVILAPILILAFIVGRLLGVLIVGVFSIIALKIYDRENMPKWVRTLLAIGIIASGFIVDIAINIVLVVLINMAK